MGLCSRYVLVPEHDDHSFTFTSVEDMTFSDALRGKAEKVFADRKDKPGFVDYEFKVHPGQFSSMHLSMTMLHVR